MKIGYARVSTDDQSLALQVDALVAAGCEQIFRDEGVSGARTSRPALDMLLTTARPGDMVVAWRLDRLGRSLSHLIDLINVLRERGVGFVSLCEAIDTATPSGRLLFHVMGALAEFERALISERTRAGIAAARKRGKRLGRPKLLGTKEVQAALAALDDGCTTVAAVARQLRISRPTLARALKAGVR
ncbi:recombinase family protein [Hyphomicrobium sp. NDB2Meth4]|uniref:recombinase family protein n=1 Tax=Hyphomicrobium sp. NDB2Meth4 TaxID=1892846 RepID=UPI00093039F6|nr:recombinase family protein [Hyphomicrobium sp. NDB2Meth4]